MSHLNQLELQNIRHLVGAFDTACEKLQTYAQDAKDPQVKACFEKSVQDAQNDKQKLMSFLS
ncbi:hypothetical protein [Cellulosilyticum sp. I15G10I2]|uniref:hypothetical protein n=1 Tax=Cellulosilyticum sp. I15G10I2 TaxID=1892843 RepID=UPI00085BC0F4|nr:hypothetical protein [Cellulosilyticum sp. I15G10I2]